MKKAKIIFGIIIFCVLAININICFASTSDTLDDDLYNKSLVQTYGSAFTSPYVNNEHNYIDYSTGAFSLKETDYVFPGKNGLDLPIIRSFLSTSAGNSRLKVHNPSNSTGAANRCRIVYKYDYQLNGETKSVFVAFNHEKHLMDNALYTFTAHEPSEYIKNSDTVVYLRIDGEDKKYVLYENLPAGNVVYTRDLTFERQYLIERAYYYLSFSELPGTNNQNENLGQGWSLALPAFVNQQSRVLSGGAVYRSGIFRNEYGEVCSFEIEISTDDYKTVIASDINYPASSKYKIDFVNEADYLETATHQKGFTYNLYVTSNDGKIYYFAYNLDGGYTFLALSDRFGNIITYEDGVITDTYGREITIENGEVKVLSPGDTSPVTVLKYTNEKVNSTEDLYDEFTIDDEYIFTVYKNENETSDITATDNVTKFYYRQELIIDRMAMRNVNTTNLPYKIEFPSGLTAEYEYGFNNNMYYISDGSTYYRGKHFHPTGYRTYDSNNNVRNSLTYTFDYVGTYSGRHIASVEEKNTSTRETTTFTYDEYGKAETVRTVKTTKLYSYSNNTNSPAAPLVSVIELFSNDLGGSGSTVTRYEYDIYRNITKETTGSLVRNYTYDTGNYHIPTLISYNKDAATIIKQVNTLTDDNKNIACTKTYENNVLKKSTHYEYNESGQIISEKIVESCACDSTEEQEGTTSLVVLNEKTYSYTDLSQQSDIFGTTITQKNITDANGTALDDVSISEYFDTYGNKVKTIDGNGNITTYKYDLSGRITEVKSADNSVTEIDYDTDNNITTVTQPNNTVFKYYYDAWGNATKTTANGTLLEETTYDTLNRQIKYIQHRSQTDIFTKETSYGYVNRVNKEVIKNPDNEILSSTSYEYSFSDGTVGAEATITATSTTIDNYTPAVASQTKDIYGNVLDKTLTSGRQNIQTTSEYDYVGNIVSSTDAKGNTTTYSTNYMGNVIRATDPLGNIVTYDYDSMGNLLSTTDAKGNTTEYEYDSLGRQIKTTSPFDNSTNAEIKTFYDANGNVIRQLTKKDATTYTQVEYTYDSMNRPLSAATFPTASSKEITQYFYDAMGNITASISGLNNTINNVTASPENASVITYEYDYLNRVVSETDPLGKTEAYTYDNFGNQLTKTTRNGDVITYTYGLFATPKTIVSDDVSISFNYNQLGLKTSMTDATGTTSYSYDAFGRLTQETKNDIIKLYSYDANSNVILFKLNDGNTQLQNTTYTFDKLNRITAVTNNGITTSYTYDGNGNLLTSVTGDNLLNTSYTYNNADMMLSKSDHVLDTTYNMTYYLDGNKHTISQTDKPLITYNYDNAGRLTSETYANSFSISYTFDNRQNRISKQYTDLNDNSVLNTSYTYNNKNQLLNEQTTSGDNVSGITYQYDFNGNLYSKLHYEQAYDSSAATETDTSNEQPQMFDFNSLDMMISSTVNNINTTYTYTGDGLRASKTSNNQTTDYVYNGMNIVAELTDNSTTTYLRGIELISDSKGQLYHTDTHGSVTALTNTSGEIIATDTYDAFGNSNYILSTYTPFGYCGEYTDAETGLIYLRARMYDPMAGRFVSEDPYWNMENMIYVGEEQKNNEPKTPDINTIKQSANLFAYCMNNPNSYKDPSGSSALVTILGVTLGAADLAKIGGIFCIIGLMSVDEFWENLYTGIHSLGKSVIDAIIYAKGKVKDPTPPSKLKDGDKVKTPDTHKKEFTRNKDGSYTHNKTGWTAKKDKSNHRGEHWDMSPKNKKGHINVDLKGRII